MTLAHQEAALDAVEEIACAPAQPALLLELCVERAGALVRADGAAVELLEGDELLYAATSGVLRDRLGTSQSLEGTLCGLAVLTGEVVVSADAQRDERGDRQLAVELGVRGAVSLPLLQDRRQIGVLVVCGRRPNAFGEPEVLLLRRLARVVSARLDYTLARDARRRSEQALATSRQKYRSVLAAIDQGIAVIDELGRIALVNPAAERILGQPAYQLVGSRPSWQMLRPDGSPWPAGEEPVQVALRERRVIADVTAQVLRADGEPCWVNTITSPLPIAEDGRRGAVVCFSDVTARRHEAEQLRHSERLLAETQRLARIGSWDWRPPGRTMTWTDEMFRLVGLLPQSVPVTDDLYLAVTYPDDRPTVLAAARAALAQGGSVTLAHRVQLPTGEVRYLHITGEVELGPDGVPVRAWGSTQDVTERHRVQEELRRMALTDPLTGLGNRLLLIGRLREAVAQLGTQLACLAVIAVDLDGLKAVNDSYGHATGDELLRETAFRLRTVVGEHDTVARLGGDEFVLVCVGTDAVAACRLAERIVEQISAPYHLPGEITAWSGASVGISLADQPGTDVDRLLAQADRALYAAKADGGSRYTLDFLVVDELPAPTLAEIHAWPRHLRERRGGERRGGERRVEG